MISFDDISKLFAFDLQGKACIEIEFMLAEKPEYQSCWMGKTIDESNREKEIYWYGLVADGSEDYSYDSLTDFLNAPVFDGKSLKEVWDCAEVLLIDGCEPEDRIQFYLQA